MPIIEVSSLHKRYGDTVAVDDISFTVERGEIFGILGRNGAGKTTTVELIEGLRKPDGGAVRVLGADPVRDRATVAERLGAQLQASALQEKLEVGEAVELYASFYDDPADGDELLDLLGLSEKKRTQYRKLSGGQKQRLSIALALIGNPEIAVLDELTTGLDPQARRDTWELIKNVRDRGVTIILVTHFMDEAERLCDRLALIEAGRLVAVDTPRGLAGRVGTEQRLRFTPSADVADDLLTGLPDVTSLSRDGSEITVSGTGTFVASVVVALAGRDVVPTELRLEQTSLEDAFVELTGRAFDTELTTA